MKKQNKAFTLVELMIVIAIIGVLAATLLPRLQGAQERSRDTGRLSSLSQTQAVLETYFSDTSSYPGSPADTSDIDATGGTCLSAGDGVVNASISGLFKGEKAPTDPQRTNVSNPCGTQGAYGYVALSKNGITGGGYVLTANVEADNKANYDVGNDPDLTASTYEQITTTTPGTFATLPTAANSIFVQKG